MVKIGIGRRNYILKNVLKLISFSNQDYTAVKTGFAISEQERNDAAG